MADVNVLISREEDKRIDVLMKAKLKREAELEKINKELRKIIYKLDRKI